MKYYALLFCVVSQCLSLANNVRYSINDSENQIVLTSCVKHSALPTLQVIVKAFNLTNLTSAGPVTCARFCDSETPHWDRFVLHVPAHGYFKDKLVCGCANKTHFRSAKPHLPSYCPQPCPQDLNQTPLPVNLDLLNQQDQKKNITSLDGTDIMKNWTCGDGKGMLSVYKVIAYKDLTTIVTNPDEEKDSSAVKHSTLAPGSSADVKRPAWFFLGLIFLIKRLIHN